MNMTRYLIGLIVALACVACSSQDPAPDATYYLVRHAEKTMDKPDPGLTLEGTQRARDLAVRLKEAKVTKIYSSDYVRTRDTAAPLADATGVTVTLYDPRELSAFAKQLLNERGQIVVVGHSNTTPQLAELLNVDGGEPIVEATEYNRLYVISRTGDLTEGAIETYGK